MSNLKLDIRQAQDILRLYFDSQFSFRKISLAKNVSRKAVSRIVERFRGSGLVWSQVDKEDLSIIEDILFPSIQKNMTTYRPMPNMADVFEELKTKGATREALHKEYLAQHPNGLSYSRFCTHLREFKKRLPRSLRMIHLAGEKVFVDYAGPTIPVRLSGVETRQAQIFVGVLGASNYIYAEAAWSQKREDWISSRVRMFEHFGGVPMMVVCDNLKAGVSKASRKAPVVQADYADMAFHYGTSIFPARAYQPKDKSKAEGGVLIIERWILFRIRKLVFTSLEQLNKKIADLLKDVNSRPFKKLPGNRIDAFERLDKPALTPLPSTAYVYRKFKKAIVDQSYHIEVDGHYYSVPHPLVRRRVEVIYSANTVEILHQGKRVASHPRSYQHGVPSTLKEHMPKEHQKFLFALDDILPWAESIGEYTVVFVKRVFINPKNHSFNYRNGQRMKALAETFSEERLENSCQIVVQAGGNSIDAVESVLKHNIDFSSPQNESSTFDADFEHSNVRGANYYH